MKAEQAKTLEALQFAIKMEIDGRQYYQKASRECSVKVGRELYEWLAGQENWHRQKFEQIYKAVKSSKAWPDVEMVTKGKDVPATLFSQLTPAMSCTLEEPAVEMNTLTTAMVMENKTYDYYHKQADGATYEVEKSFYRVLATEERKHYLALVDYREYIVDPEGWFRKVEHHSLDGG